MSQVLPGQVEQHSDMAIIEPIEDVAAITSIANNPSAAEQTHRLRHFRIGGLHHLGDIAHAQLASLQQGEQDPYPSGIAKQPEHLRQITRNVDIDQRRRHILDACHIDTPSHTTIDTRHF